MPELAVRRADHLRARKAETLEFLSFQTGGELFAIELSAVQEIVVPPPITPVPRAQTSVVGVCSVRGQLVTVVDLRICLGLPPDSSQKKRILLGRSDNDEVMGLLIDDVRQVVRLLPTELEMTTQSLGGDVSEAVRGIARPAGGDVLVLLDMRTILRKGHS